MRGIRIRYIQREDMQNFIKSYSKSYENIKEYAHTTRKDMKRPLTEGCRGILRRRNMRPAQSSASAIGFIACELVQSF